MTGVSSPQESLTLEFFRALEAMDADGLRDRLGEELAWHNTGMPTVRGKARVETVLTLLTKILTEYQVVGVTEIYTRGQTVYSTREEILRFGPIALHITVDGRYAFRNGLIIDWDDRFSYLQLLRGVRIELNPRAGVDANP